MIWKVICFDLDNTLFSHEEAFKKAIEYCFKKDVVPHLQEMKIQPPLFEEWFYVFKKNSDRFWKVFEEHEIDSTTYRRLRFLETMHGFQIHSNVEVADAFHNRYYQIVDTFSEPDEALHPLMEWLKKHEITVGIITNGTLDTQYKKIEKLGLCSYINKEHIIISEEVGYSKPNPEIYKLMEKRLGIQLEKKVFIGDAWEHDVVGAIRSGWDAIYLNTRKQLRTTKDKPIMECESLGAVFDWLIDHRNQKG